MLENMQTIDGGAITTGGLRFELRHGALKMATYDHADRHYPRTLAPVERPSLRRSPTAMRTPTSRALEAFAAALAYEAQRDALPDYDASAPLAALPTSTVSSIMPISTVFSKHTAQRSKVSMLLKMRKTRAPRPGR